MSDDYVPVDLSSHCTVGVDILPHPESVPVGRQLFHGLPFQVGSPAGSGASLVLLGGNGADRATVDIGETATWIIFAHRLLDSDVAEGGPVGRTIADYVFHFSDGSDEHLAVRERFEISTIDERLTQRPFLAWFDAADRLPSRDAGRWENAGFRQTEADYFAPISYCLFPWRNPHPERVIRSIELVSTGPRFVVAGITLGHRDEEPIRRDGSREVVVTLLNNSGEPDDRELEVTVDRGVAGFSFRLPAGVRPDVAGGGMPGWGEPRNSGPSPSYARVAAAPSATLAVRLGEEEVGQVSWSELERTGRIEPSPRLRIELVDRGRNWVRSTVVDDATGRPLPCRIHVRSAEGIPFAPHGHHAQVNSGLPNWHIDVGGDVRLGQSSYAYIDGSCEGWLPRGEVVVDAASGFEFEPVRQSTTIAPGQQEVEVRLRRWIDMNARGWFSGDTHVHFVSPQGGLLEARGEGVNVVNILQAQWGSLFTNTEDFTGGPLVSGDGRTIVYTSQENRQHLFGHLSLLGLKRPVMPWSSDGFGEAEMGGTLETTLAEWADRCHAQGGTVVIPHFPSPNGEPPVLISTGRADAVEMIRHGPYEHLMYYRYLNAGYRVPLVGGTDKMSSDVPIGLYRTYVRIPSDEEFTYESWCRNLRLGRTFMSGGPILHLSVDGHEIGDTASLPVGGGTVEVEAWAESIFPIHVLEIVQDGRVVASTASASAGGTRRLELTERLHVDAHSWFAARTGGPDYWNGTRHNDEWNRAIAAHTSPVYVSVGGPWAKFDEDAATYMLTLISGGLAYIRDASPQYPVGSVTHHHGESDHRAFLERPFHEAIAAIEGRRKASRARS